MEKLRKNRTKARKVRIVLVKKDKEKSNISSVPGHHNCAICRYTARTCDSEARWASFDTNDVVLARLNVTDHSRGYVQDNLLKAVIFAKGFKGLQYAQH